jgi:proteasome lid subunit RPN8/RPN11
VRLLVADGVLDQFVAHATECLPEEACGFLIGHGDSADRFVPATNALHSPTSFSVEPQLLFELFRGLRSSGEDMVAVCHSHPSSRAVPSNRDVAETHYPDAAHVIVSLAGSGPRIRAYRIVQGEAVEIELHAIV